MREELKAVRVSNGRREKGLTDRQVAVATVQTAFDMWFPQAEPPSAIHIIGWLELADTGIILDLIERVSARYGVRSPRRVVFSELLKISGKREELSVH